MPRFFLFHRQQVILKCVNLRECDDDEISRGGDEVYHDGDEIYREDHGVLN